MISSHVILTCPDMEILQMKKLLLSILIVFYTASTICAFEGVACLNTFEYDLSELIGHPVPHSEDFKIDMSLSANSTVKEPSGKEANGEYGARLVSVLNNYTACIKNAKINIPFGGLHMVVPGKSGNFIHAGKFSVEKGTYRLIIINGTNDANRVPRGTVKLNGKKIFTPILLNKFSGRIEVEIFFKKGINSISIELERNPDVPSPFVMFLFPAKD